MTLNVLDLFSGIGGFSLALENTGYFRTVGFCEIDPFCRRVLKKHWPNTPVLEDIKNVKGTDWRNVSVVTGGFPCQDISVAGQRAGLEGKRSGLWSELFRVIVEVQPRWVIVENVPGLRTLGGDRVLFELAGAGYACWPLVVGAVHAGAPHRRQRVWIVAYAMQYRRRERKGEQRGVDSGDTWNEKIRAENVAHAEGCRWPTEGQRGWPQEPGTGPDGAKRDAPECSGGRKLASEWTWDRAPEPVLRGVDDGLSCGLDRTKRLKALGNAVVPQIVFEIGMAISRVDNPSTRK